MFSSKWSIVALASLTACGGGLSDEQIGTVFAAQSVVSQDVATEVATEVAASGQTGKGLEFEGDLASWNLTGEIEGKGVRWSGVIGVDGSGSYADTSSEFDLALTYEEVEAVGHDAVLDGELDQGWSVTYEGQDYHAQYDMVGDLRVSGGMKGRAKIDFSMVIDYSGGQFTYEYEGSINGKDVTEMTGAGSGDWM
jgi:hypothetical protein